MIQAAALFIDTISRLEAGVPVVRIFGEELRENDLPGVRATGGKCVAHHRPLRLAPQAENFPQIMHETGEDHPARLAVHAKLLRSLKQVFELCMQIDRMFLCGHKISSPGLTASSRLTTDILAANQ